MSYLFVETKRPSGAVTVAFEYDGKLPDGMTILSAVITATEVPSEIDFSSGGSAVIGTTVGAVSGTQVAVLLKNGTAGRRYRIDCMATLDDTVTKIPASALLIVENPTARNP